LVRPKQGRYVAGVCAAIGRATNTDPVLWRVLLVVLGFFGGIGILVYLAAWLLIPSEGDTASPLESMFGKGRSSTSPILVIALAVLVALMFGFVVTDGFRAALLGAAVLVAGALLLSRANNPSATAPPNAAAGPPGPAYPGFGTPTGDAPQAAATGVAGGPAPEPPAAGPGYPPAGPTEPVTTAQLPPAPPAPPGYRPPFAPHGPYAGGVNPPPPPPPAPPKPPRERSPLGAATFSLILVVLGVVTALDVANVINPDPSAYFAAALTTVALGLLVGAWYGRARWLIVLGIVLSAALGISTIAESQDVRRLRNQGGNVVWAPASVSDLEPRYEQSFGQGTLDLRDVDFTDHDAEVDVTINAGNMEVTLPDDVDVTVSVRVRAGDAVVLGREISGVNVGATRITDDGDDGAGGGQLRLNLVVNAGHAEVDR
jgi:phage shock protein PspC (stress-responsive transcriptional regulator)